MKATTTKGASPDEAELQTHLFRGPCIHVHLRVLAGVRQRHPPDPERHVPCARQLHRHRDGHGQRAGAVHAAAVRQAERQDPHENRPPYAVHTGRHHSGASVPRHHARSTEAEQRPAVLHRPGDAAHCHGHLPQPRRGPDAGRHTQAPAQPGQRRHQPDGRRGRHADAADDDDLSRHRGYAPLFRRIPCAGAGDGRLCGRAVLADQGTGLRG